MVANLAQASDRWQAGCCENGIEPSGSVKRGDFVVEIGRISVVVCVL
jgi:hypothetical protein